MRSRRLLLLLAVVVLLATSGSAGSDIRGPFPRRWGGSRGTHARQDWQRARLLATGGAVWPTTFPGDWKTGTGWGLGLIQPVWPMWDLVLDGEVSEHSFNTLRLRRSGATVSPVSDASFADLALGLRFHRAEPGWRPFGHLAVALPDVSRPTVFYTDVFGAHQIDGSEIFGLDPGLVTGAGMEFVRARRIGGEVEARAVLAPGRTRPSELLVVLRAGLSIPLP